MRGSVMFWAAVIAILFAGTILYVIHKVRRSTKERRARADERAAALLANVTTMAAARAAAPDESTLSALLAPLG